LSLEMEFEAPTWDQIYEMLLDLAERVRRDRFLPDIILGISRGGWPPARVMSDLLGTAELANVKVEFYVGVAETEKEPVITQPISVPVKSKDVLILDDVADTGQSLRLVKNHVTRQRVRAVKIATIYYKPWSVIVPDYYEKQTTRWVVFPWERKETIRSLIKKSREKGFPIKWSISKLIEGGLDRNLVERFVKEVTMEESQ